MKRFFIILVALTGCHYSGNQNDDLSLIQIQDRNGLTETISTKERLVSYQAVDFLTSQPYKKVLRVYKHQGKNSSRITTYHPNGVLSQYLEAEEMRANGIYREWFPNGQLKIEARVIGGTADLAPGIQQDWIFDSTSKVWDEKGNLIASIPYSKGVLEGTSVYYYPNGQLERELSFVQNNLEGVTVEYWPNGKIKSETEYKKGNKEGVSIGFFDSGNIAWTEKYTEGLLLKGSYYKDGNLISEVVNGGGFLARFEDEALTLIEHRSGLPNGQVRMFTKNGEILRSFSTKNRMKHGEEIEYFLSSELENESAKPTPKLSIIWNENRIHGCAKTWYNNGQQQSQRDYCRNQRMGPSLAWYRDGSLMLYEEYEEDRLVMGQYYKKQKKEQVSSVVNGNGLATLYDEEGAFLRKVTYLKGKAIDPEE